MKTFVCVIFDWQSGEYFELELKAYSQTWAERYVLENEDYELSDIWEVV